MKTLTDLKPTISVKSNSPMLSERKHVLAPKQWQPMCSGSGISIPASYEPKLESIALLGQYIQSFHRFGSSKIS